MKHFKFILITASLFSISNQGFGSVILGIFDICSSDDQSNKVIKQDHNNQRNEQALQKMKQIKKNIQNRQFDMANYIFNNRIPLQCRRDEQMFLKINPDSYIGQGGQSMVFGYDDKHVMKVSIFSPEDKETLRRATNEFEYMTDFARENNILFSYRPSCFIEQYNGKIHFILKQEKREDSLAYSPNNNISGGEKIFQIENLKDNVRNRFLYYEMLFEQLEVFYDHELVHSDVKPENIMTNIKFDDIINKKKKLAELELHIIDYGLMQKEDTKEYSGTINFMHPYFAFGIKKEKIHELDVYSLCLTILVVEMYQSGYEDEFLFSLSSNLQGLQDLKQLSQGGQIDKQQAIQFANEILDQYKMFFMDMFLDASLHEQFNEQLNNFKQDNYKDFYKNNCMNNFHCVLISAFQANFEEYPSATQILKAFKIIQKKKKLLIIQFQITKFSI